MRYTLRLLTSQQFQRAAALVCAAELMRQADPDDLGRAIRSASVSGWGPPSAPSATPMRSSRSRPPGRTLARRTASRSCSCSVVLGAAPRSIRSVTCTLSASPSGSRFVAVTARARAHSRRWRRGSAADHHRRRRDLPEPADLPAGHRRQVRAIWRARVRRPASSATSPSGVRATAIATPTPEGAALGKSHNQKSEGGRTYPAGPDREGDPSDGRPT